MPAKTPNLFNDDSLSKAISLSLAAHAIVFAIFGLRLFFFPDEEIDLTQAIRVDMVGLPDKISEIPNPGKAEPIKPKELPPKEVEKPTEKPAMKTPEKVAEKPKEKVPVKETKDDKAIALDKTKTKQASAIEKLKQMAAIEKLKAESDKDKTEKPPGKDIKIKGAVISPGTSLTGLSKLQHQTYIADLDKHIKNNWALPEWLGNQNLKAQARVYLDDRGLIISRKIVRSSGNPSYDSEVLSTIDRSAPFPAPPEKFTAIVSVEGILIGFPE